MNGSERYPEDEPGYVPPDKDVLRIIQDLRNSLKDIQGGIDRIVKFLEVKK